MSQLRRYWRYLLGLPRRYTIGGLIVIVLLIIVVRALLRSPADTTAASNISHVRISSVASLTSTTGPLPVTGKVTSLNQATILAQTSGEIVSLNAKLGDRVAAGQVIASFENSSQRAAVLQAEGVYDAAVAALAKAKGSTAANAGISAGQASTAAQNAGTSAISAIQSLYAAMDDAVHAKADPLFSNPNSITPTFNLTVPDSQTAITLQNQRASLNAALEDAAKRAQDQSAANIDANATAIATDAQTIITFLTTLVKATNMAQPNQSFSAISTYQANAAAARSAVVGAVSTLATAKTAYDAAVSGAQTASNSATTGSQNDIAAAEASVKQARGALDSARANLEKTVVRSPITGTIVTLTITRGDYVSSFAQVAQVSNPGALEIETNVTPDDAKTLVVGGKATIDGSVAGVITSIAPALDPTTGKIQVKVGITGDQSKLTDGDTVGITLERESDTKKPGNKTATTTQSIMIPIIAAKLTPTGAQVFTVSSTTLVAHPITLGPIVGTQVTVTSGLTPDMVIVTDARGLTDGQQVIVEE